MLQQRKIPNIAKIFLLVCYNLVASIPNVMPPILTGAIVSGGCSCHCCYVVVVVGVVGRFVVEVGA